MAPAAAFRVSSSSVEEAVNALLKYKAAKSAGDKLQLLPEDDYIYLNLTLKKIPSNPRTSPFKIPLSHPILDLSSQVCLIIDDRPQTPTPPADQIKKLVKSLNLPISKVLKISKLKSNYKPYEARRKLCGSYELFLVDKRVVHLLPKLIGKEFFKKKKLPLGVDLGKSNLKFQVEQALGSALLYVRTGTCCVMKVGKLAMEKEHIVENVIDAITGAVDLVPKMWDGVRSLHLKFFDSVALPLYQALPDIKLKIEGSKEVEKVGDAKEEGDSEADNKGLSGDKDGGRSSNKKKSRGRIHEVHYMDLEGNAEGDDMDAYVNEPSDNDGMVQLNDDYSDSDEGNAVAAELAVVEVPKEEASGSKKGKKKRESGEKASKKKAKSKEEGRKKRV